jgi:hypothetical protein
LGDVLLAALVADVVLDDGLAAPARDRGNVVAVGSELSAPEGLFDVGVLREHGLCGDALQEAYDLASRVLGQEACEEVDVVLVEADLTDFRSSNSLFLKELSTTKKSFVEPPK